MRAGWTRRRIAAGAGGIVAGLLLLMLLLVSFGWGLLRHPLERRLSARFGRAVTIGGLSRIDHGFLHPVLAIRDVAVAQPAWAPPGAMIAVRQATVRLPLGPLLLGQAHPQSIAIDGLRVALLRLDTERANWKGWPNGGGGGGGARPAITIRDGRIRFEDRKRDQFFTAAIAADASGFRMAGRGTLAGHPTTLALRGAPLRGAGAWPFRLDYRSAIANTTLAGRADHPLDVRHFAARAVAWGTDARDLDRLIEAGLPGTQPIRLAGQVRRDADHWALRGMAMRIGRSTLDADLDLRGRAGRTLLTGTLASSGFDFDDLASNEGLARAAARRAATGPRAFPDTRIRLDHLRRTDAALRVDLRRLLFKGRSPFRSLAADVTLDHGVLTASHLVAGLASGRVTGTMQVRHRSGDPLLTLDLRLGQGRIEGLLGRGDTLAGAFAGRVRLAGTGDTVRAAIGRASGGVGFVVGRGTIARRGALFLGGDAGRALLEGKEQQTALRCAVLHLAAARGIARIDPLVIDTAVGRADGRGTIALADERLDVQLTGAPKLANAARLDAPIGIGGTIERPKVVPPQVPKTAGTVLKLLGRAIGHGDDRPRAADADCGALARAALR